MASDITISSGRLTLGGVKPSQGSVASTKSGEVSTSAVAAVTQDSVSLSSPVFLEKITQIQGFLEQISYGETVISTALDNTETIIAKLEEVGGVALKLEQILRSSVDPELLTPQKDALQERVVQIFGDIDNLSKNNGFPEENVLQGDVVSFATGSNDSLRLSVEGYALDTQAFGFDGLELESAEGAQYLKGLVLQALDQSALLRSQLRATSYELETRKGFSENTIEVLLAQAQQSSPVSDEASALRHLQADLFSRGGEEAEFLAFDAQYELLEQFK